MNSHSEVVKSKLKHTAQVREISGEAVYTNDRLIVPYAGSLDIQMSSIIARG